MSTGECWDHGFHRLTANLCGTSRCKSNSGAVQQSLYRFSQVVDSPKKLKTRCCFTQRLLPETPHTGLFASARWTGFRFKTWYLAFRSVAYSKAITVLMVCEGLDVPGLRQIEKLSAYGHSDLLPRVSINLAQLTKGFGLPVDRVHATRISE